MKRKSIKTVKQEHQDPQSNAEPMQRPVKRVQVASDEDLLEIAANLDKRVIEPFISISIIYSICQKVTYISYHITGGLIDHRYLLDCQGSAAHWNIIDQRRLMGRVFGPVPARFLLSVSHSVAVWQQGY
jgi:hypothetical protein